MSFNIDEIKTIIKQVLHENIGSEDFVYDRVRQWNVDILTQIIERLKQSSVHSQLKFVVTVLIGKKDEQAQTGLHTALSCLWDGTKDGCVTVKWENHSVFSITTVLGLAV